MQEVPLSPEHPQLQIAIAAARLGGDVLLKFLEGGLEIREKATNDLVTNADISSEREITAFILGHRPDHHFLAEESHHASRAQAAVEHLWIIDPLDGTTNFAHGIPHFAVSVAYYRNGKPECGVVFNPVRDELFFAVKGQGAFFQGQPIRVGDQTSLSDVLIGVGFYYDRGAMMQATLKTVEALFHSQIRGIRRFGTASLDLCQVAIGRYGAFFEYQLSPWDFAAGGLIVEEAGGQVTTASGESLPIAQSTLLATNGILHSAMLQVISETADSIIRA